VSKYIFNAILGLMLGTMTCGVFAHGRPVILKIGIGNAIGIGVSECQKQGTLLAGGMSLLRIFLETYVVQPQKHPYQGISTDWPQDLTIEAGTVIGYEWRIVPGLSDRLHLQRWNWFTTLREDSIWRSTGKEPSDLAIDTTWYFTSEVPADLVNQRLFFQVTLKHPIYGTLENLIPPSWESGGNAVTIVAPCSEKDRDRALGAAVYYADMGGDRMKAVALADSLIPLGWRDLAGLEAATQAEVSLREDEKSLQYLDLNFAANGRVCFGIGETGEAARERYESRRKETLEVIQIRQQEQH
jgi:hypothetical protein